VGGGKAFLRRNTIGKALGRGEGKYAKKIESNMITGGHGGRGENLKLKKNDYSPEGSVEGARGSLARTKPSKRKK